jgi:predicted TIM-barrel fold metal-dependent hydrolase
LPESTQRIDVHTHYMTRTLAEALESRGELPRISERDGERVIEYGEANGHPLLDSMLDIDRQLNEMSAAGIDLAVMTVNVPGADWFPESEGAAIARAVNDELIDVCGAHPDRLAAMALLPMQVPEQAAAELERAVGAGLRGGIIYSNIAGSDLDEAGCGPVIEAAAALDVPLMIHPTFPLSAAATDAYALIPSIGFLVDTSMAALRLIFAGLYERHPNFRLYLCHAGSLLPQLAGRIDYECCRFPGGTGKLEVKPSERIAQLYTDTVCNWPQALRSALELVGPDRLMFGSDYPFWRSPDAVATLADAELGPDRMAAIESSNAIRLFRLEDRF